MRYSLRLLGRPELLRDGTPLTVVSRKGKALIYYLACHVGRVFGRPHLINLLWCDHPKEQARRNFNTMLSRLRSELPVWPIGERNNGLTWDDSAGIDVDVIEFSRLAGADARAEGGSENLRSAVALWRGAFCEGFGCESEAYDEWLEEQRRLWEGRVLAALGRLVELDAAEGRWDDVLQHCRSALSIDRFQETFHRWIMTAYGVRGERTRALSYFHELSQLLQRELGVEPDAATADLVRRLASREPVFLPGRPPDRDQSLHAALGPLPAAPRGKDAPPGMERIAGSDSAPFVGRSGLVDRILRDLASGAGGRAPFVFISGEAGIGKSRLVDELLAAMAFPSGAEAGSRRLGSVVLGRCTPYGEDLPYAPLVEGISRVLASVDVDNLQLPDAVQRDLSRVVPELRERLSQPDLERPQEPTNERLRIFQGISRFVHALPGPVAVVVEDLHWVDSETLAALTYLAAAPSDLRNDVIIIATSRSDELPPEFAEFAARAEREGRWFQVRLGPLSERETRDLVASVWNDADPDIAGRIHSETGGNPLYILEVARFMRGGGYLERGARGKELGRTDSLPVPPAVDRAVSGRMAGLSDESKSLLTTASIFQGGVEYSLLQSASGLADEAALAAYESLSAADFLRMNGERVSFAHDIVRRAVAATLSAPRLAALHRRAYDALARMVTATETEGSTLAERLAYHAREAGLWREAVHWGQEAAREAERLFAYAAACRQLDRTLEALERLPKGPEHDATVRRVRAWRFRLEYWFNPRQVDSQFRDSFGELRPGAGAPQDEQPEVLLARAEPLFMQGEVDAAQPMLERVIALVEEGKGPAELGAFALGGLGAVHMIRGDFGKSIESLERVRPLLESAGRRLPGQNVLTALASAYALIGDFDRMEACMAGVEHAQADAATLAKVHGNYAMAACLQGRWEAAVSQGLLGMECARSVAHHYNEYFSSIWVGAAQAQQEGAAADALESIDTTLQLAEKANTLILVDTVYSYKALALLKLGRLSDAQEVARTGRRIAESYGFKLGAALCTEALGQLAAAQGDHVRASQLVTRALHGLEAIGARPFLELALKRIPAGVRFA